ncbi:hypothetical protein E4U54_007785 [Claviceps lovelessii]|nr:hypothetical protein E4U54_007785 [Claviceps lovelessii]
MTRSIISTQPLDVGLSQHWPIHDLISEFFSNFDMTVGLARESENTGESARDRNLVMIYFTLCRALDIAATRACPAYGYPGKAILSHSLLAIVIGLLPNLSSLSFSEYVRTPDVYFSVFQSMNVSLSKLKQLSCTITLERAFDLVEVASNLEELHIHHLSEFHGIVPRLPKLRVLRILRLQVPLFHCDVVERMVEACEGGLREFTYYQHHTAEEFRAMRSNLARMVSANSLYSITGSTAEVVSAAWEDVPDLTQCLDKHKNSLTRLDLDVQQKQIQGSDISSLADYVHTDTLTISPWYGNTWCLPPGNTKGLEWLLPCNLRVLRIRSPCPVPLWWPFMEKLLDLAEFLRSTNKSRLSSLEMIECAMDLNFFWARRLDEVFSEVGIEFTLIDGFDSSNMGPPWAAQRVEALHRGLYG